MGRRGLLQPVGSFGSGFATPLVATPARVLTRTRPARLESCLTMTAWESRAMRTVKRCSGIFPAPHGPVYTATKHGVVGFTRAIALTSKLSGYGVRINTICPAFVDTPLLNSVNCEEMMGKYYIFKDSVAKLMQHYGVLEPALIVQGLMKILQEEELNGAVMKITKSKGIHFENYEASLIQPELK